jgi:hypothetical protein
MARFAYELEKQRQKMYVRAYTVLCLIIVVAGGIFFFQKWNEYEVLRKGLIENENLAATLKTDAAAASADYEAQKENFGELSKQVEKDLQTVMPGGDQYTDLTRKIDEIEQNLSSATNVFEVSSLDFQNPVKSENYSVLPFRMSIRSSATNFVKFLHLIETSGSLTSQLRLMDIPSIRLNFQATGNQSAEQKIINFTVQINAYFQ